MPRWARKRSTPLGEGWAQEMAERLDKEREECMSMDAEELAASLAPRHAVPQGHVPLAAELMAHRHVEGQHLVAFEKRSKFTSWIVGRPVVARQPSFVNTSLRRASRRAALRLQCCSL